MATENNTQDEELLPPAEQIKRNQESLLAPPVEEPVVAPVVNPVSKPELKLTPEATPPAEQIAQNEVEATGEPALLPPAQQILRNQSAIANPKPDEASVLPQRIQAFDPEKPDYFIQDYIKNLESGKEIYEAHKANPKLKWGVKQSMAMKDYMDSPESGEEGAILNAVKGVGEFLLKGVKGAGEFAGDVFTPPETEEQAKEQFSKVLGDVATVGDVIAGVPLEFYQLARKIDEGGIQLADDLGIGIDPNNGTFTFTPKTKAEKLVNFMTRNDIDADRAIVNSKAPSNVGKILYYAGEAPTESGQQSYAQLLRPLLASYLVPSIKQRMLDNTDLTEGEATAQWMKDSDTWGTKPLQDLAQQIPAEKENIAAAAMLALPQASTFGVALGGAGMLGKGLMEMGRLAEIEALMPQARAMTDTARTAATGGTFVVDAEGNITAAPSKTSGPRTKEQIREDFNNAEQLHADNLDRIDAENFERSGGKTIRFGPFNVPKPYVWAGTASDSANAAAEKLKSLATTGALATAIPATTGIIGAYRNRDNGLTGMAGGLLRGIEYGAAGELLGYGALKTAGKVAGVFSDLGKVSAGLQGSTGNVFDIAGNIPTSTKLTQNLFGGKIGSITAPTANWFANNLSQLAYQGVEAGALAAAMGILDSVPTEELPAEIASGMAMVLVPHMISSAIHESPAARESRLNRENASINQVKQQASPESRKNAANISDYRNVVNLQKQIVADRTMDYRRMAVDPKAKPEDLQKAQELVKAEDEKLTEIMSANSQTRREYGRQNDLMWANSHRGLNGPLRSGQNNVGIEILTKDQILQKLVEKNKEYASTPQGMAMLEHIASEDGFVINSAGGVELRAGDDLAEALKTTPIMFDPSKTTAIINADASMQNSAFRGAGMVEQLGHETGHLYARTKEFQEANRQLLSEMFSTNTYNEDGSVAHEEAGYFSNQQMKDLFWNKYLKNRTDAEKKAWLASKGLWDTKNDKFIDRTALAYYREEIIADMANNVMKSRTMDSADGYLLRWAGINHSNNILARAIQGVLGVGGKYPIDPAFVSGAEFTPEMMAQTDRAMRQVEDYYGHIAPVIDAEPAVSITTKDMMKSKGLLKKYGITSGMFQTSVFGIVRNARGEVVAKVPLANPAASEGTWVMDKATGRPKQVKGYDRLPDELDSIPVPDGGTLEVSREVAMQPDGETPILLSASEQKKGQNARRDAILNALGVTEVPETGVTWRGTFTPEQVENIKRLPEHIVPKAIKDVILQMNESLARGDGTRWIVDYSPTSGKKGKRKSLTMKPYDVVPISMHLTKDGNFNITVISATRLFNKLHAWGAEFPHILDMWGGSKSDFFNEFTTKYLKNWQEGKAGETGLDPDPKIAEWKRDTFRNFLNLKDKDTDIMSQNWLYLKKQKGDLGPEGRDRTIMSMRADHVSSMIESNAQKIPVDYYKAKINAMPESGLPYEERPEDAPARETAPAQEERRQTPFDGITATYKPASGAELTSNLVASGTSLESFGKDTLAQLAESYGIEIPKGAKRGEIIDAINERPIQAPAAAQPQETKFSFTTSTERDDAIKRLIDAGDDQGIRDLNRTTILSALADLKNIQVAIEDAKGVYKGDKEVSSIIKVTTNNQQDLNRVRSRIADAAKMFQQMEFLEEKMGAGKRSLFGETDEDGFKHMGSSTLYVEGVTEDQIEEARKQAGIDGLTLADGRIELYDRSDDPEFFNRVTALDTAIRQAGGVVTSSETGVASVKSYSEDPQQYAGTIGYDDESLHLYSRSGEQERLRSPLVQKLMGLMGRPMEAPESGKRSYFEARDVTLEQVRKQAGISQRFADLPLNDLANPLVKKSYDRLNAEILKQYDYLTAGNDGTKFTSQSFDVDGEPYRNSGEAIDDIRTKNSLKFLKTDPNTFGPEGQDFSYHPLLQDSGRTDANGVRLVYNDLFRAVHDAIAHGLFGAEFGPVGEESAWQTHMRTIEDPWARWALTTETRGQNSFVNYRDQMIGKDGMPLRKGDEGYIPLDQRGFAEQKAALLPLEDSLTGDKKVDEVTRKLMKEIGEEKSQGSAGGISFMPAEKIDSAEFKDWFGNYEEAKKKEYGVWGDPNVSKVVDSNGNPLVVYHGSDKSGFTIFGKPSKGFQKVEGAYYFAENKDTARSYAKGTSKEAKLDEVDPESGDYDYKAGLYPVYLDLKNPYEYNMEGANWDGTRYQQYQVVDGNGDIIFTPEGRQHLSKEEAEKLAEENSFEDAEVEESPDEWESTDTIVKRAMDEGYDGVIIRDVVDQGQAEVGSSYEPTTIYVAFDPTQIKSATQNVGTYSRKNPDIRFMPYSPELPKTEDGKVDWSVFTQEAQKPLSTLRAYAIPQQQDEVN